VCVCVCVCKSVCVCVFIGLSGSDKASDMGHFSLHSSNHTPTHTNTHLHTHTCTHHHKIQLVSCVELAVGVHSGGVCVINSNQTRPTLTVPCQEACVCVCVCVCVCMYNEVSTHLQICRQSITHINLHTHTHINTHIPCNCASHSSSPLPVVGPFTSFTVICSFLGCVCVCVYVCMCEHE
jgi:hypothetical protein